MDSTGTSIAVCGVRVPAFVAGLSVSIAVHAGLLATLSMIPSGRGPIDSPALSYSLGQPIQVQLGPDPDVVQEIGPPESSRPDDVRSESFACEAASKDDTPSTQQVVTHGDAAAETDQQPLHDERIAQAWDHLQRIVRAIEWTPAPSSDRQGALSAERLVAASPARPSKRAATEEPAAAPEPELERAMPPTAKVEQESPRAEEPVPRGLDRGVSVESVPQPVYPRRSIRLRHEGIAVVEITVRADGSVASVKIRTSSGHKRLDEAAIEAARLGVFIPALVDGHPVKSVAVVPFEFRLTR